MQETILRRLRGDLKQRNERSGVKVRYEKATAYTVTQAEIQEYHQYLLEDLTKIEADFDSWDAECSTEEDSSEEPTQITGGDGLDGDQTNGENFEEAEEAEEEAEEDAEEDADDADDADAGADEDAEDAERVDDM